MHVVLYPFFFFHATATTAIYTLSLHDALPICPIRARARASESVRRARDVRVRGSDRRALAERIRTDRKSTRLNSSHTVISYAVFCLKKKKQKNTRSKNHSTRQNKGHNSERINA